MASTLACDSSTTFDSPASVTVVPSIPTSLPIPSHDSLLLLRVLETPVLCPLAAPFVLFPQRPFFLNSCLVPLSRLDRCLLCEECAALGVSAVVAQVLLVGRYLWVHCCWFFSLLLCLLQSFAPSPATPSCFSSLHWLALSTRISADFSHLCKTYPVYFFNCYPVFPQSRYLPSTFPLLSSQMVPFIYTFSF